MLSLQYLGLVLLRQLLVTSFFFILSLFGPKTLNLNGPKLNYAILMIFNTPAQKVPLKNVKILYLKFFSKISIDLCKKSIQFLKNII
jgi:hypothetical protein